TTMIPTTNAVSRPASSLLDFPAMHSGRVACPWLAARAVSEITDARSSRLDRRTSLDGPYAASLRDERLGRVSRQGALFAWTPPDGRANSPSSQRFQPAVPSRAGRRDCGDGRLG